MLPPIPPSPEELDRAMAHVPALKAKARVRQRRRRGMLGGLTGAAVAAAVALSAWLIPNQTTSTVKVISPPTIVPAPTPSSPTTSPMPSRTTAPAPPSTVAGDYGVLQSFQPESTTTWWAVVASNLTSQAYVVRTTDSGHTWQDVFTPPGEGVGASYFLNSDLAWIAPGGPGGPKAPLYRTTNGGRTWQQVGTDPDGCELQFVDPSHGWCIDIGAAAGSSGVRLYRTSDGGSTWSLVSRTELTGPGLSTPGALPPGCDKTISFTSPTVGWASSYCNGGDPYLYTTSDGGSHWHPVTAVPLPPGTPAPAGAGLSPPVVQGSHIAIAETIDGRPGATVIATSSDNGKTWQSQLVPTSPQPWKVDLIDPTHWRLTNGTEVMSTNDAGAHWHTSTPTIPMKSPGTYGAADSLDFLTPLNGWAIPSPDGGPFWRTDNAGSTWTAVHITAGPYNLPR